MTAKVINGSGRKYWPVSRRCVPNRENLPAQVAELKYGLAQVTLTTAKVAEGMARLEENLAKTKLTQGMAEQGKDS